MEKVETKTTNIFGEAKEVTKSKAKSSTEYNEVVLSEKEYPMITDHLAGLEEARNDLADAKGREGVHMGIVKQVAIREYLKMYAEKKINPKTFIIRGEHGGCFMIQPTDRYKGLDDAKADYIEENYGEDFIDKKEEYVFDMAILMRGDNMNIISRAIIESDLSESDKGALLTKRVSKSIAKGSIDRMAEFSLDSAFGDFAPIVALKNYK